MINYLNIGLKPYNEVLALQKQLHEDRVQAKIPDTVIFCEHHPVYTVGRRDCAADWLSDFKTIAGEGIDIIKTDRGGRITYHGPGQLIIYFIIGLKARSLGVKEFVNKVEEMCMRGLKKFGVNAIRDKEYPGLWVDSKKIAALGFHISKGVSMHGVAINVAPDLSHYKHIVPCGIKGRGITSMKELLGIAPSMNDLITEYVGHLIPHHRMVGDRTAACTHNHPRCRIF